MLNVHTPSPAQCRALRCHVLRAGQTRSDEPLRQTGVQTARHRVFGHRQSRDKGAHFKLRFSTRQLRRNDTQLERTHGCKVRLERQHLLGRAQHHGAPTGAVVDPLVMQHITHLQGQCALNLPQGCVVKWPCAAQRWRGKCQTLRPQLSAVAHAHQAHTALLHNLCGAMCLAARCQPCKTTAQRRVASKRQLGDRREDTHAIVGLKPCRGQQKCCF